MPLKVQSATKKVELEMPPDRRTGNAILTTSQRLEGIEQMRKRVNGYIDFMCAVDSLRGSSEEAKEAAVAAFYDRLAALERQLEKVSEGLRLG